MDKKLLDKLSGFNLSMQQKMQLIDLMKNVGGNKNNAESDEECSAGGGSSRNDFVISLEQVEQNGAIAVYYNFNGKYRAKGHTKSTQFDILTITNTEIYNYCLENMISNIIVDAGIFKIPGYITICDDSKPSLCLAYVLTDLSGGSGSALAAETHFSPQVIIEPSNEN